VFAGCSQWVRLDELHDRVPVILGEADWRKWLGEEPATGNELLALFKTCADDTH
jgi:putative SOS response-associated peptidase YedK